MTQRMKWTHLASAIIILGAIPLLQGQQKGKGMMMYNTGTETTIKGTVESLDQGAQGMMMKTGLGMGTHLAVKTAEGDKQVMLGPTQFLADKGFSFAKGDQIEVTGSKVAMGGSEYLMAREVVKDGKTLVLRNRDGRPAWSGGAGAKAGRGPQSR
jgi:hypothetical protein